MDDNEDEIVTRALRRAHRAIAIGLAILLPIAFAVAFFRR
jgi:hypothetical protein